MVEKIQDAMQFMQGVRKEFSRVVWPTKSELIGSTLVVIFLMVFFAVYLGVVDFFFSTMAIRFF